MSEVVHYDCNPGPTTFVQACTGTECERNHSLSPAGYKVTCPACLVWLAIDCLERACKAEPKRARMRVDEVMDAAMGMRERAA